MKIIVNNLATEYRDEGEGKVILLLHGWWDTLKTFDLITSSLINEYRVIRLDLPGFGGTEKPDKDWNLNDYINFVEAFINKLNLPVDFLLGHSMGGRIIIKGQSADKLKVQKNILIAPAGNVCRQTARNLFFKILAKIGKIAGFILPKNFWENKFRRPFYRRLGSDYAEVGALRNTFLNIINEDLTEATKKVSTPTLLIWGGDDIVTPLSDGKKIAESIKNSTLKVIEGATHFVHQEKAEEVVEVVDEFITL